MAKKAQIFFSHELTAAVPPAKKSPKFFSARANGCGATCTNSNSNAISLTPGHPPHRANTNTILLLASSIPEQVTMPQQPAYRASTAKTGVNTKGRTVVRKPVGPAVR